MVDLNTAQDSNPIHLDTPALLQAVLACYGAQQNVQKKLQKIVSQLTSQTNNWAEQGKRLDKSNFSTTYLKASVNEILDLPGELAILKLGEDKFALLRQHKQRWQALDADGQALAEMPAADAQLEAIVLSIPVTPAKTNKLNSFSSLWYALRAAWAEIGLASLFINAGLLLVPLFSMLIYDKVISNSVFETLWALTLGMVLYLVTDSAMRVVRAWSTEYIAQHLTRQGDESIWQRLIQQTELPGGFARFISHYRNLSIARDFTSSTYLLAIVDLPFLFLYLLAVALIAWPLAVIASLLVFFYAGLGYILQRRTNELSQTSEQRATQKLSYMSEVLNALDVLHTVPKTGFFLRRWRNFSLETAHIDGKMRLSANHSSTLSTAMMTLSTVTILVAGAYLIDARSLSVGGLIACNILTARAMSLVTSLYMVIGKWQDFQRAAQRMEDTLKPIADRRYTPLPVITGHITLSAVSKQYEGRPTSLDAISLSFSPGERVGLLGKPGAGKTTLLRCIAGLNQLDEGQILIDGVSLEDIDRTDRSRWMAWKAQEPTLFAGTLEENLRVAGSPTNSDRFKKALWASGLEDELTTGRLSLGMQLDERGSNLSGGQKQKVALARVLAQDSHILLLDEPTLGLDPESERLLAERLPQCLGKNDVLLMTTHSAIMLNVTQRVIALDNGHVVADGDTNKLVKSN